MWAKCHKVTIQQPVIKTSPSCNICPPKVTIKQVVIKASSNCDISPRIWAVTPDRPPPTQG
jgi:hypothetical protein